MPNGDTGLSIASGIAQGAQNFVSAFMQARRMKHEEALQKNAYIIEVLTKQLQDENMTGWEKANILNQIPKLLGVKKMDRTLSDMIGLDSVNRALADDPNKKGKTQTLIQGEGQLESTGDEEPGSRTYTTVAGQNQPLSTSGLDLSQTSVTQRGTESQKIMQGDLTPAQKKRELQLNYERDLNEQDFQHKQRLAELEFNLKLRAAQHEGWITKDDLYYNKATDSWNQMLVNKVTGETKTIAMPKGFTPSKIIEIQERNKNRRTGKLGQLTDAQDAIDRYESGDTTVSHAEYTAAKSTLEDFEKTGKLKEAQTKKAEQDASGTRPVTPAQSLGQEDRDRQLQLNLETARDKAKQAAETSSIEARDTAEAANEQAKKAQALEAELKQIEASDGTDSDAYKNKRKEYDKAYLEYKHLERIAHTKAALDKGNKEALKNAEDRLSSFGTGTTKTSTITAQQRTTINNIRAANPEATKDMSDQDIINWIRNKHKK